MNGPTTNWSVLQILAEKHLENKFPALLNVGSCGLHLLYGVLGTGLEATQWNLGKILKAMWQIFHNSPARQHVFICISECHKLPLYGFFVQLIVYFLGNATPVF